MEEGGETCPDPSPSPRGRGETRPLTAFAQVWYDTETMSERGAISLLLVGLCLRAADG
jgi:hypothetical protein